MDKSEMLTARIAWILLFHRRERLSVLETLIADELTGAGILRWDGGKLKAMDMIRLTELRAGDD